MKDVLTRKVTLIGLTDIMFDRYPGDNKTTLQPEDKMYFARDGKTLIIPSANIHSFLSATNTDSAPKRLLDSREYKKVAAAFQSYINIEPLDIVMEREGKPIVFNGFSNGEDKKSKIYIHETVARLAKGIPNPKVRPVVSKPWSVSFALSLFKNEFIGEPMVRDMFDRGGIAIGLGTYRGTLGKFMVDKWE